MTNSEIDRLVAEKVMGWHIDEYGEGWLTSDGKWARDASSLHSILTDGEYWHPSTNIAQAMEALEPLGKLGYYLVLSQNGFSKGWVAKLVNSDNPNKDRRSWWAYTPAAAICLAIVGAVKGVVEP